MSTDTPHIQTKNVFDKTRLIWASIALICFASMSYALYAEHMLELKPCNLCMLQRASMTLLGLIAFTAFCHHPKKHLFQIFYSIFADLAALSGVILAGRHVWLQHLPEDQIPACGPDFDFLIEQFPIMEVITEIFQGSGQCAEIQWQFLSFSMPEILLGVFTVLWSLCHLGLFLLIKDFRSNLAHDSQSK